MKYNGLLFLDIDGTLFRWSLFLYLVDKMIEYGIFSPIIKQHFAVEEKKWRERKGAYDEYLNRAVDIFDRRIKGLQAMDVERCCLEMVEAYKDQVYRFTRDLIKEKLKEGWYVVAISCSPEETVIPFANYWGIQESHGSKIEVKEGIYTGVKEVPSDKYKIVENIIARSEFIDIAKENIWGIGDSEGDINFLETVGHPICFNPTLILYQEAQKRGWAVVVERKNVIYNIN